MGRYPLGGLTELQGKALPHAQAHSGSGPAAWPVGPNPSSLSLPFNPSRASNDRLRPSSAARLWLRRHPAWTHVFRVVFHPPGGRRPRRSTDRPTGAFRGPAPRGRTVSRRLARVTTTEPPTMAFLTSCRRPGAPPVVVDCLGQGEGIVLIPPRDPRFDGRCIGHRARAVGGRVACAIRRTAAGAGPDAPPCDRA